jgi:hypothetical protein
MQRFVAELLTAEGALVEPIEPEGLEAVIPPTVVPAKAGIHGYAARTNARRGSRPSSA